jgi:exopolysaccharide production protein ExoQ
MLKRVNQLEYIFFGVALTLMVDSFYPIFQFYHHRLTEPGAGDSDPIQIGFTLLVYIVSFASFVLRPKSRRLLVAVPAILILLLVAVDSSVWSADPAVSLRRVFALAGTFAFAHYLMARLTFIEFIELFAIVIRIIIVASFIFHAIDPYAATMDSLDDPDHVGGWRGVTGGKNSLGALCSLGFLLFYYLAVHAKKAPLWNGMWAGLSLVMIFLAGSATSLAVAFLALALDFMVTFFARRAPSIYFTGIAVTLIVTLVIVDLSWSFFLEALARDSTLTGRTDIWALTIAAAEKRPWLGYGYGQFWDPFNNPECLRIWIEIDWAFTHAHNGWIETWLELGLVGVAALAYYVGQTVYRCLIFIRENRLVHSRLMFLLVARVRRGKITETSLIEYFDADVVMLACVAITAARYAALRRSRDPVTRATMASLGYAP